MNKIHATRAAGGILGVFMIAALTGCSDAGDLGIANEGPSKVSVLTGDHRVDVASQGGAEILDYGCTPGDVTVEFDSGAEEVLAGPVCPEERIMIGDGTAWLQQAPSED